MFVRVTVCAVAFVALAQCAGAQAIHAPVAVHGVAYDSLRRAPLSNAFVMIAGSGLSTSTDERGRFTFDSVVPGPHVFNMQHVVLDSIGLSGLTTRATVTDGADEVSIAVPSFATLWRAACGAIPVPRDSGIVHGMIRDASVRTPVANAIVRAMWSDSISLQADMTENPSDFDQSVWSPATRFALRRAFTRRRWRMETTTDANGGYTLCGVPTMVSELRVQGVVDSSMSGAIDVPLREHQVYRRDLQIGVASSPGTARKGMIAGILTDRSGTPFAYARVSVGDLPETRSGEDGRFTIRDVPIGTRQVDVRFVGMEPVTTVVEVDADDTSTVHLELTRITTLRGLTVVGSGSLGRVLAQEFDARRRQSSGYFADSTSVGKYQTLLSVLRSMPSVQVESRSGSTFLTLPDGRGGRCVPNTAIDGAEADYANLLDLETREVAGLEVHVRAMSAPVSRAVSEPLCGVILVWTKYGFRTK
ncbi:MAG: carboxypeptidase regulatory-like domain-containing protein [bacterium]